MGKFCRKRLKTPVCLPEHACGPGSIGGFPSHQNSVRSTSPGAEDTGIVLLIAGRHPREPFGNVLQARWRSRCPIRNPYYKW